MKLKPYATEKLLDGRIIEFYKVFKDLDDPNVQLDIAFGRGGRSTRYYVVPSTGGGGTMNKNDTHDDIKKRYIEFENISD
ncbi:MAG: hypothetical protein KAS04_05350 [Candidatus Aenigmarchaeota archaeon]|nr:hypothetical protein [Candidatus Aenigmarchaeota archaeon]